MQAVAIRALADERDVAARLAVILAETVAAGGSVHFMHPVARGAGEAFWHKALADAASGKSVVLGAFVDGRLCGTVTLYLEAPPNGPFRGEIRKLMVLPAERRRGIGRALVLEAEQVARAHRRTLLTLDTAVQGGAGELYEALGWVKAGVIPEYAYEPHGTLVDTVIYYRRLAPPPPPDALAP